MANGVVIPTDIKTNGSTNITGVKWVQRDNVVEVTIHNVSASTATLYPITGLPKPKTDSILHTIKGNTGLNIIGYCQYSSSTNWNIYFPSAFTAQNFCNFTYLTDNE